MASNEPYDSSDPEQVRVRQLEADRRAEATKDAIVRLLNDPDGRAWVWSELVAAHMFEPIFPPGTDPYTAAFRDGERNAGLRLLALVNSAAPSAYVMMQREAAQ